MEQKKAVVILSGGMDSTTALAWAKTKYHVEDVIHFQYGSKHNLKELQSVEKIAAHYGVNLNVIHLPFDSFKSNLLMSGDAIPDGHYADESMKKTVVPFRNGIMLSFATGIAESKGASAVILGNHFGDHAIYPDCRADFAEAMRSAIALGTYAKIEMLSPFQTIDKTAIAKLGHELSVPFELTWTCYKGREKHCGTCGSCTERKEAFQLAGVKDPTAYEQ